MLLVSDGVGAANNLDSSFEAFQEWASRRSSPSFILQSLGGKSRDANPQMDASL